MKLTPREVRPHRIREAPRQFHEAPYPWATFGYLRFTAQRLLGVYAPSLPREISVRLANEALLRVVGFPPELQDAEVLRAYGLQAGAPETFDEMDLVGHAQEVGAELNWEQFKHGWLEQGFCKRYGDDPDFRAWFLTVPPETISLWKERYLPSTSGPSEQQARTGLSLLVPTPREVRREFADWCRKAAGNIDVYFARPQFAPWLEYLLAMASQRLVAVHTLEKAVDGPDGVSKLWWRCRRQLESQQATFSLLADQVQRIAESPSVLQTALSAGALTAAISQVGELIEDLPDLLSTRVGLRAFRLSVTPEVLLVARVCSQCRRATPLAHEETALPPFNPRCRCCQLSWLKPGAEPYARNVRLWGAGAHFGLRPAPAFPLEEFLERALFRQQARPELTSEVAPENVRTWVPAPGSPF